MNTRSQWIRWLTPHLPKLRTFNSLRFSISKSRFGSKKIQAMTFVKRGQPLLQHLINSVVVMGGNKSPNWVRTCMHFLREVNKLHKHGGVAQVVLYLKCAAVITQQVCAGYKLTDITPLKIRISRAKSGLPRIIPSHHRLMIMRGDYRVMRWYLTFFSLYRDLFFIGRLDLSTITDPCTASGVMGELKGFIKPFLALYFKGFESFESIPSSMNAFYTAGPQTYRPKMNFNSSVGSIVRSLTILKKSDILIGSLLKIAELTNNNQLLAYYHEVTSFLTGYPVDALPHEFVGRLHTKEEAAGKVRVFAMVDPWTQWALDPLHKLLFKVLKRMPTDGTFDQLKPLQRLPWKDVPIYSFDLSAATDRLPLEIQKWILNEQFKNNFGDLWADLLVQRPYKVPSKRVLGNIRIPKDLPEAVFYKTGQPMGALSSWAMLAITHHFIVHFCAWRSRVCGFNERFTEYAVLGDDIVIWNKPVADMYISTMKSLGVKVGLAKSVLSPKGKGLEFAKRTIIDGIDVSPVPYKQQQAAHSTVGAALQFAKAFKLSDLSLLRFLGYGYKVSPNKVNRTNLALKIAQLVPTTSGQLYSLSIQHYGNFLFRNLYVDDERKFQIAAMLIAESQEYVKITKSLHDRMHLWLIGEQVSSIGPWRDLKSVTNVTLHENAILKNMRDLTYLKGSLQLALEMLKAEVDRFKSIQFVGAIFSGEGNEQNLAKYNLAMFRLANVLFEAIDVTSRIQLDHLFNPHLVKDSKDSPSQKETKAKLRVWNKWSNIFLRMDMPIIF